MAQRPALAVAMGDPAGIGPEVLLKALCGLQEDPVFTPRLAGAPEYLRRLAESLELEPDWGWIEVDDIGDFAFPPRWGRVDAAAGRLAIASMERAVAACRDGSCLGLVMAPVSKEALRLAGFGYAGQTEFLAARFERRASMAFLSDRFHLLLATTHIPLRDVAGRLTTDDLVRQSGLFFATLQRLLPRTPRVAVCGLNPHASEAGLIGDEEERVVAPAVQRLRQAHGSEAFEGPFPPDTLFRRIDAGEFDGVVALYHDQGLIPLKLTAFESAVNTTLGLPVVRTSPDHGTAFDIAGRGVADPTSMRRAFDWALRLVEGT